ncbi:MAG: TetR family transcriptional regulator [Luminiphilus sp.]|jgi:AcrR family transcriptional regulator
MDEPIEQVVPPSVVSAGVSTQAERSALSDQRMFEVAIELVNERGTAKTTLKDIGERAGYSRGLASYRFGSKDGLWMELFARFDEIWKAHLSQYLAGQSGIGALRAAMQAQRDIFSRESGYLRAMYILWYESLGRESDIRASLARHHVIYRRDVRQWIEQAQAAGDARPDIDAEHFAVAYCSTMFGTIYQWVVAPDAIDINTFFDSFAASTLAAITQREG